MDIDYQYDLEHEKKKTKIKVAIVAVSAIGILILIVLAVLFYTKNKPDQTVTVIDLDQQLVPAEEVQIPVIDNSTVTTSVTISEAVIEEDVFELEKLENGKQELTLAQGWKMDIPGEWSIQSVDEEEIVFITATEPFVLTETVSIYETDEEVFTKLVYANDDLEIYDLPCAPAIGCFWVGVDDGWYQFDWSMVESDQEVPEDLDGPWFPEANFDYDDVIQIMITLK